MHHPWRAPVQKKKRFTGPIDKSSLACPALLRTAPYRIVLLYMLPLTTVQPRRGPTPDYYCTVAPGVTPGAYTVTTVCQVLTTASGKATEVEIMSWPTSADGFTDSPNRRPWHPTQPPPTPTNQLTESD
jgi:hypothetical protein